MFDRNPFHFIWIALEARHILCWLFVKKSEKKIKEKTVRALLKWMGKVTKLFPHSSLVYAYQTFITKRSNGGIKSMLESEEDNKKNEQTERKTLSHTHKHKTTTTTKQKKKKVLWKRKRKEKNTQNKQFTEL